MTSPSAPAEVVQADRELCAFLRREAKFSGIWFAPKLAEAAARIEALNTRPVASTLDAETVEACAALVRRMADHAMFVMPAQHGKFVCDDYASAVEIEAALSPGKTGSAGEGEGGDG